MRPRPGSGAPWLVAEDLCEPGMGVEARLQHLVSVEAKEDIRIQEAYAKINDEVYRLYGIPDSTRAIIEDILGGRPRELLWQQTRGKIVDQKRMEHVFRLLSYVVKRVVEEDEDGIVPYSAVAGEPSLADRVHGKLQALFPMLNIGNVEAEIANELKTNIIGYRRTSGIAEWLEKCVLSIPLLALQEPPDTLAHRIYPRRLALRFRRAGSLPPVRRKSHGAAPCSIPP